MSKLKAEANNILRDNYESLYYGHSMQQQLNSFEASYGQSVKLFENALAREQNNITEKGEKQAADTVKFYFNKLKGGDTAKGTIKNTAK